MSLTLAPMPVPLREEPDGTIRVGGSRMLLEVFVTMYARDGLTAQEIVSNYPSIAPADVYLTIAYYEANRAEVDAYVADRARLLDEFLATEPRAAAQRAERSALQRRKAAGVS